MNDAPPLLTAKQVSQQFQVHERTVRRWAIEGIIPSIHIGPGTVRFDPAAIAAFIDGRKSRP